LIRDIESLIAISHLSRCLGEAVLIDRGAVILSALTRVDPHTAEGPIIADEAALMARAPLVLWAQAAVADPIDLLVDHPITVII
jgi:hypothetical protein